jgi:paraquat-inducible protein A
MDALTPRRVPPPFGSSSTEAGTAPLRVRDDLVVCEECDAVYARQPLEAGEDAHCPRCRALLGRGHRLTADGQLALSVAALLVFAMANLWPIVTLDLRGNHSSATLYESIRSTWSAGEPLVAVLAGATAFVFPLFVILLRLYVLVPLALGWRAPGFTAAMRSLRWVTRWSMVEVLMLGVLVAVVRSAGLASTIPGVGLFAFAVLTALLAANQAAGLHRIWQRSSELGS